MQTVRLGRTEAFVSVAGLGCGGHSRLGMARGASEGEAARVVSHAIERGVTFIDTARIYGTEGAVGRAIADHDRPSLYISTKSWVGEGGSQERPRLYSAAEFTANLEDSLRRLGTDYVDLFHFHGVSLEQLPHVREVLLPAVRRQQELGKVRHIGLTEIFRFDTGHAMLREALPTGDFDVVMVGFNLLNQTARATVFPVTQALDLGTLIMFAVRRGLNSVAHAAQAVAELVAKGEVDEGALDPADPFGAFTRHPDIAGQLDLAYRFCRHEPGAQVVLTGTGSTTHLDENLAAIQRPPLPEEVRATLMRVFARATSASGE
ncbi:aldo/keto reductase [Alteraurantiacibacter buctensis]|uniref:Aldo/keto reductase n=1 Tax=Alteraurantiacibacter buctensis TaxID=1503981 RepID=A0A844YW36_9SPHN|nr:aldo/keto reductase [Alteraurantiacibacter buctensis]MXO71220.1 aldo/keto reductase [Alteraurantiacibacter buctensis]